MTRRRKLCRPTLQQTHWIGTELSVTYKGLDLTKDAAVRRALGKYDTGSGFLFKEHERDHSATVPDDDLARVLKRLRKIKGITIKRLVKKWVRIR